MFREEKQSGGGFNFGITNYRIDVLEEIPLYTPLKKKVMIERQFTYGEDSGYGIYQAEDENGEVLKLSGVFPSPLHLGLTYEMKGKVVAYRGEKQFSVETAKKTKPVSKNGLVEFLKNLDGLYRKAEYLYEVYGDDVLDLIRDYPNQIVEENPDMDKDAVLKWKLQIEALEENPEHLNQLLDYGLTLRQAKKIYEKYGEAVIEKIHQNPYLLVTESPSFGFEKADEIAKRLGYDPKSPYRIQEGVKYVLKEATGEGHCFLPVQELIERAVHLLVVRLTEDEMIDLLEDYRGKKTIPYQIGNLTFPISYSDLSKQFRQYRFETNRFEKDKKRMLVVQITRDEIQQELAYMNFNNFLMVVNKNYYLPELYEAECRVAQKVLSLSKSANHNFSGAGEDLFNLLETEKISLEEKQKEAVLTFSKGEGGFYILNGSAGCGKTFTLNIILRVLGLQFKKTKRTMEVKVLAPTGKASKVAGKSTQIPATTIHRGLKYKSINKFEHNNNNPLDADVVVVDETSMIDINLVDNLLSAIAEGTKVIFLGDTKQLPSVGAGNVLQDLIDSNIVQMVTLNVAKRQGKNSGIIRNANRIVNGEMISSCKDTQDAYVLRKETLLEAQFAMIKSIREVQKVMNLNIEDIQVLCPQKTSLVGTNAMNYLIQQEFNAGNNGKVVLNKKITSYNHQTESEESVSLFFKIGDKVIQMKNNYDMLWYRKGTSGVFTQNYDLMSITNGETGMIVDIIRGKVSDTFKTRIVVRYEDGYVFYDDHFSELEHAYALTIHKSQGSQWKAVIIPIMMQNYNMLDNNLFYTGYTRAQSFCVIVGQADAILHAIRTHKTKERYTSLKDRLLEYAHAGDTK